MRALRAIQTAPLPEDTVTKFFLLAISIYPNDANNDALHTTIVAETHAHALQQFADKISAGATALETTGAETIIVACTKQDTAMEIIRKMTN